MLPVHSQQKSHQFMHIKECPKPIRDIPAFFSRAFAKLRNPFANESVHNNADGLMSVHQDPKWRTSVANQNRKATPKIALNTIHWRLHLITLVLLPSSARIVFCAMRCSRFVWVSGTEFCVQKLWSKSISGFNDVIWQRNDKGANVSVCTM